MKILLPCALLACLFLLPSALNRPPPTVTWGFYAHRKINRQAVFTLPPEMMPFFKKNIGFLSDHATDADVRRFASRHEAPRHFLDLDRYGSPPFPDLPRRWTDALMQYSNWFFVNEKRDTLPLLASGSLPSDSLVAFNPALFNGSATQAEAGQVRLFFIKNVLPQYYEDTAWTVSPDSLSALLGTDSLDCRRVFVVDTFSQHGVLPWHLSQMLERLTEAFRQRDARKILRLSADLGHYLADAHVPLHTTRNYNGQLTGQDGIHAFWESRLPELFAEDDYDFWVGRAELIEKPEEFFWNVVLESHSLVDSVLAAERSLRQDFPPDRQLCHEVRGDALVKTQCEDFAAAYQQRLGGMVERRMRDAILTLGSAWHTAWVLAGQPDLNGLDGGEPSVEEAQERDSLERSFRLGKIFGRAHEQ